MGSRAGLGDLVKSGNSRSYRDSNKGSSKGVPGHHAECRRAPTPHFFEPGLSGKAIDQSTVPIHRLPSSRDSRHKKSNVTESEKFNFRAHRHWRNLANIMGEGGGGRGPRRHRVLRCLYSTSCKARVFHIFVFTLPKLSFRKYF